MNMLCISERQQSDRRDVQQLRKHYWRRD